MLGVITPDGARHAVQQLMPDDEVVGAFVAFRGAPWGLETLAMVAALAVFVLDGGLLLSAVAFVAVIVVVRLSRIWVTIAGTQQQVVMIETGRCRAARTNDELSRFERGTIDIDCNPTASRLRVSVADLDLALRLPPGPHRDAARQLVGRS